jgi:hypothetical protein
MLNEKLSVGISLKTNFIALHLARKSRLDLLKLCRTGE